MVLVLQFRAVAEINPLACSEKLFVLRVSSHFVVCSHAWFGMEANASDTRSTGVHFVLWGDFAWLTLSVTGPLVLA